MTPGAEMYAWAEALFPICRSLTGPGVRETLAYLQEQVPQLRILSVPSGTSAFDWTVPDEWSIRGARLEHESGQKICDFRDSNLHVMGYSTPVDCMLDLAELQDHLHSLPELPEAIPYVTSYYKRNWGFCLPHKVRAALPPGRYRAVIDSTLAPGVMNYGEIVLPGAEPTEILISTNICHPSLANNELSGPVVVTALARWLAAQPRRHTYRLVFLPETIGSITYLSTHLDHLRKRCIAGFVVTCCGDNREYSLVPSRTGDTLADRVARHVLRHVAGEYVDHGFLKRGSDERQYCSPQANLPVVSVMRSKHSCYPEYHTSLDDLTVISPDGLQGTLEVYRAMLELLEGNRHLTTLFPCEPFLNKRGLYPAGYGAETRKKAQLMMDLTALADGSHDVIALAEAVGAYAGDCLPVLDTLTKGGVLADWAHAS